MYNRIDLEEHDVKVWKNTKLYRDAPEWEGKDGEKRYQCNAWKGVAVWVLGWVVEYNDCTGEYENSDDLYVVMVGDDTAHRVSPSDLAQIKRSEYCSSCGQIGCAHGAMPDDD